MGQSSSIEDYPDNARSIKIKNYLGCWSEQARYYFFWERNCTYSQAEYRMCPSSGKVKIRNNGECMLRGIADGMGHPELVECEPGDLIIINRCVKNEAFSGSVFNPTPDQKVRSYSVGKGKYHDLGNGKIAPLLSVSFGFGWGDYYILSTNCDDPGVDPVIYSFVVSKNFKHLWVLTKDVNPGIIPEKISEVAQIFLCKKLVELSKIYSAVDPKKLVDVHGETFVKCLRKKDNLKWREV